MPAAKTTLYVDPDVYLRLKAIARRQGKKTAAIVREALAEYARKHAKRPKPRSLGIGNSGRADLSERVDELLEGMGRPE